LPKLPPHAIFSLPVKKPMHETPQFPHLVTVKSSAGAGKTYNLALRYLQLLTNDRQASKCHISNIVAITFTNKAASEMRSRIIDWMKRIILDLPFRNSPAKPIDEIIPFLQDPASKTALVSSLESDFDHLIRNFYDFKVGTIDSFVNLTLKASAFKLGLPPDFDISLESTLYVDSVLQECLQEILEVSDVRRKFDAFLRSYIEVEGENTSWSPKAFLRETVYRFWKEEAKENKEFVFRAEVGEMRRIGKQISEQAKELILSLNSREGVRIHKGFLKALEQLSTWGKGEFKGSAYYKKPGIDDSLLKGSAEPDDGAEKTWQSIRSLIARLVEVLAESKFSSYLDVYRLFKERLRVDVTYRKRLILIEELNKLLQNIICDKHFIPEIYYALAERYVHFLIDEFQDTNHLQWKNIEVLADEALSRGGTLFLVGDKKQAIYRWRGGRSELVDEIASIYSAYRQYPLCLDTNYRSGEHVVAFNNIIFDTTNIIHLLRSLTKSADDSTLDSILDGYQKSEQQCLESKKGEGYVYVEKILHESEDGETADPLRKEEKMRLISERVRTIISEIRVRNVYEDKEIAVLVRRKDEAEAVVKTLLHMGLNVDSEYTVNVKNNPLVKEIIAFLQFVSAPQDDVALGGFLTGTIFERATLQGSRNRGSGTGGRESELFSLPLSIVTWITSERLRENPASLYRSFQSAYPDLWNEYFEPFFKSAGYLPLYELFVLALKRWEILSSFPDDAPYFLHVCELIKKREGTGDSNLTGFLQFWSGDQDASGGENPEGEAPFLLKTAEGANAIKVLTIHKAKGLQFPVVILPFLKLTSFGSSDGGDKGKFFVSDEHSLRLLHIKKDFLEYSPVLKAIYDRREAEYLIDELNSMYVAFTRAEQELYILLADSERQKNLLPDYFFNIDALRPRAEGTQGETAPLRGQARAPVLQIGVKQKRSCPGPSWRETRGPGEEDSIFSLAPGRDLRWMEKIKGKFERPEGCTLEHISAKRKGDVIHYILSCITFVHENYETLLRDSIHRGIVRFTFQSHRKEIEDAIFDFFAHPPFRRFFLHGEDTIVYTEKELVDRKGAAYKVDRIIIHGNFVDIIDFKTGETRSPDHIEQIANYGRLLKEIHKEKTISEHILYIDENRVETL
jgi:ATP-dependent helicase/nuclease subunit A